MFIEGYSKEVNYVLTVPRIGLNILSIFGGGSLKKNWLIKQFNRSQLIAEQFFWKTPLKLSKGCLALEWHIKTR